MTVTKQTPQIITDNLELDEVFPAYSYYYHYVKSYYDNWRNRSYTTLNSELSAMCQQFNKDGVSDNCKPNISTVNFLYLGRYLYYLKEHFKDTDINKVYACTYFSYKLKQELKNVGCGNEDPEKAYKKIIELKGNYLRHNEQNFNVCEGTKLIENFDDTTLSIFRDLDELYKNFYTIKGTKWNMYYRKMIYGIFKRLLSHEYVRGDKHKMKNVLKRFKKEYDGYRYCEFWWENPEVLSLPEVIYNDPSGNSTQNNTTTTSVDNSQSKIKEEKNETLISNDIDKETKITEFLKALAEEARNEEKLVEVSTSTTVIIFTVLIVIFLLYKYTVFGSYLHPRTRKLKKQLMKRNNIHLDLMDSFERSYNNSFDNTYEIGYRSLDY
ncbi:variable surface protein [Plasmodium gonderi]|uniref:Variable surface protein n=1 Tax=Plasmodium gonderi TaxID=77519 RepID=A0A1Y1JMF4_PLAGO|nr:variable surface protein [Plasmodium gonderi]GAW82012.1 variable surface protein [Plasmodium gonderi]